MTKCSYADKYKAKRAPKCGCQTCEEKWKVMEAVRSFMDGGPGEYYNPITKMLYSFVKDINEKHVKVYYIMDFASVAHIEELCEKYKWMSLFKNCPYGALSLSNQLKEQLFNDKDSTLQERAV